jgi:hypothetical protein
MPTRTRIKHHRERKALLYVRQSSAYSGSAQPEQLAARRRVGLAQCAGYERMVAEVCLGKVGAVVARISFA